MKFSREPRIHPVAIAKLRPTQIDGRHARSGSQAPISLTIRIAALPPGYDD
jgi:hypothetical protein